MLVMFLENVHRIPAGIFREYNLDLFTSTVAPYLKATGLDKWGSE